MTQLRFPRMMAADPVLQVTGWQNFVRIVLVHKDNFSKLLGAFGELWRFT
jgi:hypothetical protein